MGGRPAKRELSFLRNSQQESTSGFGTDAGFECENVQETSRSPGIGAQGSRVIPGRGLRIEFAKWPQPCDHSSFTHEHFYWALRVACNL